MGKIYDDIDMIESAIDGILYGEESENRLERLCELCGNECINDTNTKTRRVGF